MLAYLRIARFCILVLAGALGSVSAASAWNSKGHQQITAAALESLSLVEPQWSPSEKSAVVRASVQPDLMRPRELSQLRAIEAPRHFLDLELLQGKDLPDEYWAFVSLLTQIAESGDGRGRVRLDRDVTQVGTLPYALAEATQRLAAIFAQVRTRPGDPELRVMAAHQAGFVAHYAQDLCQPLHTTVHHDGRARENGSSPHSGIHRQADALIHQASASGHEVEERTPRVLDPLFPAILSAFRESHSQVDRVYELEGSFKEMDVAASADPQLVAFAVERYEKAVGLTTDLIYTAWHLSSVVELPGWAQHPETSDDGPGDTKDWRQ